MWLARGKELTFERSSWKFTSGRFCDDSQSFVECDDFGVICSITIPKVNLNGSSE